MTTIATTDSNTFDIDALMRRMAPNYRQAAFNASGQGVSTMQEVARKVVDSAVDSLVYYLAVALDERGLAGDTVAATDLARHALARLEGIAANPNVQASWPTRISARV